MEQEWWVGLCVSCLEPLDPTEVGNKHVGFCSEHCRKQAEKIRYVRQAIRDGRSTDPLTALVIFSNMITFLAFDLAYTRPRLSDELRQEVLAQNDGRCVSCNKQLATEVDHIDGGSVELSNLRGLCQRCHVLKARGKILDDLTRATARARSTPVSSLRYCSSSGDWHCVAANRSTKRRSGATYANAPPSTPPLGSAGSPSKSCATSQSAQPMTEFTGERSGRDIGERVGRERRKWLSGKNNAAKTQN